MAYRCNDIEWATSEGESVRSLVVLGLSAAYGAFPAPASAQAASEPAVSLSGSIGVDYSTGSYGTQNKTDVVLVPLILRARSGDFSLSTSVTYIRIDGPADVVIGPDGEQLPGVPTTGGVREGLSDLSVGAGYSLRGGGALAPQLSLSGRVKLPTSKASDQLSTGKIDYAVRADLSVTFGALTPFASIGYRVLGDPAGSNLRNGVAASVGASATIGRKVLIASFDYSSATSASTEDSRSLFAGFSMPVSERLNLTGYSVVGLSENTPDYGVGLLFTAQIM